MIKKNRRLLFAWFTSIVFLAAYFIFISSANVFQVYAIDHKFSSDMFPSASIFAMRLSLFITLLCTLKSFQNLNRQHFLMLLLLLLLLIVLLMPLSFNSYPAMAGLSNAIFDLTEPWRQFYAPPALRATIEGVTEGLTGIIDLSSVAIEQHWSVNLSLYHYVATIFVFLLVFFWMLARKLENTKFSAQQKSVASISIGKLLRKYPYIFLACLFGGINTAIFNYTLFLIKANAPQLHAQNYQYSIYLGSIIGPIIIGRLADKKGIFSTLMYLSVLLILLRSTILTSFELKFFAFAGFYIGSFFLGALTASVWTLTVSLVGERLRSQGIFRAFAISNIFFQIGFIIASRVYQHFDSPFHIVKLSLLFVDIVLVAIIRHFYKKETCLSYEPT
jgi:hypothetical protein